MLPFEGCSVHVRRWPASKKASKSLRHFLFSVCETQHTPGDLLIIRHKQYPLPFRKQRLRTLISNWAGLYRDEISGAFSSVRARHSRHSTLHSILSQALTFLSRGN